MGMAPSEFWRLALPEIPLWLRGGEQRKDDLYEIGLLMAWHTAYWTRVKTLPSWESIKAKRDKAKADIAKAKAKAKATEPAKPQNWMEMKGIMAAHRMALAEPAGKKAKPHQPARRRK